MVINKKPVSHGINWHYPLFCNNFVITLLVMEVNIIAIGNSKGIRLSKSVLERYNIKDRIEIILERGHIILKPIQTETRKNWDKAFKQMHQEGDDHLLFNDVFEDENFDEWN